jgi:hypothetical protein
MARDDHEANWAIAAEIQRARPQWLVTWGRYSRRFWGFPLFEMRPRMVVWAGYPGALVDRLDEAERRFRVWPDRQRGNDGDAGSHAEREK